MLASGRVNDRIVLLQFVVSREEGGSKCCQVTKRVRCERDRVCGYAQVAGVPSRVVVDLLVLAKSLSGVEGL